MTDLARLGSIAGDVVMVHASLRKIGPVEGGAAGVLRAIQESIGPEGTMLMVLGARDDHAWVNDSPEEQRPTLLIDAEPFDPLVTPADPEVGILAEVFRQQKDTIVNDHPEARFGARGAIAGDLLRDPPWNDYFGRGSPLARLVEADGKVLRIGADEDTTTLLHLAEYEANLPHKRRLRRHRLLRSSTGPEIRVVDALDDMNGIVDVDGDDYFVSILRAFLDANIGATGPVGNAAAELLPAKQLLEFAIRWMEANLVASKPPQDT